ncbi:unnamed protein product, partial [Owenia fusiformis]
SEMMNTQLPWLQQHLYTQSPKSPGNQQQQASIPASLAPSIHIEMKQCELCLKQFRSNQALKRHMFIHTGEKPYVCPICSATFSNDGSLSRHKKKHRNDAIGRYLTYM